MLGYSAGALNPDKRIMPFARTWMDLKAIILSEVERKRQIPYVIIYMWNLKYDTNELIYKKEIDS